VLADAGVAARRVCERLIEEGHVRVNGQVLSKLPVFVDPENDTIEVDGHRIKKPQRRVYLMLNKPAGTLVTGADEEGMDRPTIMNLVRHPAAPRLFSVGRLDQDTTGLVLLTNDGELANRLTHPRFEVPKTYHVVVRGLLQEADLPAIGQKLRALAARGEENGRGGGGPPTAPRARPRPSAPQIQILRREDGKTLLEITLREGGRAKARSPEREQDAQGAPPERNQLREALRFLGMPVKKLARVGIGPLRLKGLAVGDWRELTRDELHALRKPPGQRPSRARNRRPDRADNQTRPRRARTRGHRA
jgi:16S rRNA U516 pseudouridylate synthase RsuA-like enzyme